MRVMVTGGAGYIGSVVVAELLADGHEVVVFDNLNKGHRQAVSPYAGLVVGDLADGEKLVNALHDYGVECVVHMASFIEAGESVINPTKYFRNNVMNCISLLGAMVTTGVSRFVFSSSAGVYGDPERIPIDESAPLRPTNPYGESKLTIERLLPWYERAHKLRYVSLRYFNAAGAAGCLGEDHSPETHLIPIVLQVALGQRLSVSIFGTDYPTPDGTCIRDYIHVVDLAQAHVLALRALGEGCASAIYNLGNGNGFSVREVIEVARQVTGQPIPAVESSRRPGDPAVLVASSQRIVSELGWQPRFADLATIIRSAWEWHGQHPQGYER
ncbi:MAG: UDP-glucose 4-epimerase GalE [Chloroflexi bacterium]|nr:UDP-glucose 4-epimerase GalE [Chloroflexota bacterium]